MAVDSSEFDVGREVGGFGDGLDERRRGVATLVGGHEGACQNHGKRAQAVLVRRRHVDLEVRADVVGDRHVKDLAVEVVGHDLLVRLIQPKRRVVVLDHEHLLHRGLVAALVLDRRVFLFDGLSVTGSRQGHERRLAHHGHGSAARVLGNEGLEHHRVVAVQRVSVQIRQHHRREVVHHRNGLKHGVLVPVAVGDQPKPVNRVVAWAASGKNRFRELDVHLVVFVVAIHGKQPVVDERCRGRLSRDDRGDWNAAARHRGVLRLRQELRQQAIAFAVHVVVLGIDA